MRCQPNLELKAADSIQNFRSISPLNFPSLQGYIDKIAGDLPEKIDCVDEQVIPSGEV